MSDRENQQITIAVVGDVHDLWEAEDELALKHLGVDLVLFVGDFGNESVEVVRAIANLTLPKAAVMGNHDAWYSATDWGRKRSPYDHSTEDRVQQQLDLLGEAHVGYGKLDLPELQLSIVGSRPFSWGGPDWRNKEFYQSRYNVNNFAESTLRIVAAAESTLYDTVIFLGHNGPVGLGDKPEDTCGRDWNPKGGDYGDPDLAEAIAKVRSFGKNIPLVTFGHMHHRLRHTQERLRAIVNQDSAGTIYLNSARVPRIINEETDKLRNFSLVSLSNRVVTEISLVWVKSDFSIVSKEILYQTQEVSTV
ncbi:MAG: TIGR04168 family protein [Oscillatoria sp. PMC 1068.18]|nr:TIGR04168 family protein [Oscillatoria sp. PMC 1076.18]MEC4989819.1 TIGR04168 family protein [Oscillatoria sp. PMC 1068.18]